MSENFIIPTILWDWGLSSGLEVGSGNSVVGIDVGTLEILSQLEAWKIPRFKSLNSLKIIKGSTSSIWEALDGKILK